MFIPVLNSHVEVPFQLERIETSEAWLIGVSLFLAFFLIALAQRMQPVILKATGLTFFQAGTKEELESNDVRINSFEYLLLTLSFLFSFGVCLYEWVNHSNLSLPYLDLSFLESVAVWKLLVGGSFLALGIIIYPFLTLAIGEWITGAHSFFVTARQQTWISFQFVALVSFVTALLWVLNPNFSPLFQLWIPWLVAGLFLLRFIKCFVIALMNGAPWYYLILYFCTLEILPMLFLIRCLFRIDCNCLI